MDAAQAVSNDNSDVADVRPPALLRGTARGLEIHIDGGAPVDAILGAVRTRLDEAPAFFRGSDVRIKVDDGPLPAGCLSKLDELAVAFDLRIVEVAPVKKDKAAPPVEAVPQPQFAAGSAPAPAIEAAPADVDPPEMFDEAPTATAANPLVPPPLPPALEETAPIEPVMLADSELTELVQVMAAASLEVSFEEPTQSAAPLALAATAEPLEADAGTRLVVGPVRSGVILDHKGHLIIFGDVNPGAEVRAEGNIVVLGRLRGTAHAGIGQDVGFILALRLEPQQLRIGRKVARAADSDTPAQEAEIASLISNEQIVVERFTGKLPRNLAASL